MHMEIDGSGFSLLPFFPPLPLLLFEATSLSCFNLLSREREKKEEKERREGKNDGRESNSAIERYREREKERERC